MNDNPSNIPKSFRSEDFFKMMFQVYHNFMSDFNNFIKAQATIFHSNSLNAELNRINQGNNTNININNQTNCPIIKIESNIENQELPPEPKQKPIEIKEEKNLKNFLPQNNKTQQCKCQKSKCLKLYCPCFGTEEICGIDCECTECKNNYGTLDLRNQLLKSVKTKNPKAFDNKFVIDDVKKLKISFKGCHCKNSFCVKKYCDCYRNGAQCSEDCICNNCKNMNELSRKKQKINEDSQINLVGNEKKIELDNN